MIIAPDSVGRGSVNVAREALQNHRFFRPIIGKLRKRFGFTFVDCSLAENGEVDPTPTTWAAADKTGISPPRSHKWIVYRPSERFQAEIDRLQALFARRVRTRTFPIDNMRCHCAIGASLSVEGMHLVKLRCILIWHHAGHHR